MFFVNVLISYSVVKYLLHYFVVSTILANIFWDRYENRACSVHLCSGYL